MNEAIATLIRMNDYVQVVCKQCGRTCKMTFPGLGDNTQMIQIECAGCGHLGAWRLWEPMGRS